MPPPLRFTLADCNKAHDTWFANCGPVAVVAICGLDLDEVRLVMGDFEKKRYTNPTLMFQVLDNIGCLWSGKRVQLIDDGGFPYPPWPKYGLARVQWEGPWTKPGVPVRARYRHTHWVGSAWRNGRHEIFDVNCMCAGGWVPVQQWSGSVVPWLLKECVPRADGRWHLTHVIEIDLLSKAE